MREMGYEPVLFERGHVAYGKDQSLEDYCYREISSCDILVAIVGGKFGTQSKDEKNSITQKEIKTAIDLGKQIYIFVEKSVHSEYRTYLVNKEVKEFKPASVDSLKVFSFLEEVYALPVGNPVEPFELSGDITQFLREQFAGLFQRLLQEATRQKEVNLIQNLQETATTLNRLVTFLSDPKTKNDGSAEVKDILLTNHPAFAAIKRIEGIRFRVTFLNLRELDLFLKARGYKKDPEPFDPEVYEWDNHKEAQGIRVRKSIFDEKGVLKVFTPEEWDDDWITEYSLTPPASEADDEIPF